MTTPITTETTTTTEKKKHTHSEKTGIHAVLKNTTTGEIVSYFAKTRPDLGKELQALSITHEVLHVYKGRELAVKEKVSFSFN